mmetsp:Transcript_110113/g.187498  ORF Transcript_110113/g.187498 Transcript_110113/m.187498 type:complete len:90 (+) Transcript_110113:34-303(+)
MPQHFRQTAVDQKRMAADGKADDRWSHSQKCSYAKQERGTGLDSIAPFHHPFSGAGRFWEIQHLCLRCQGNMVKENRCAGSRCTGGAQV